MRTMLCFIVFLTVLPMGSQQLSIPRLEVSLRCAGVETVSQSRVVKSAAYGSSSTMVLAECLFQRRSSPSFHIQPLKAGFRWTRSWQIPIRSALV